jgi:hypothetical protein
MALLEDLVDVLEASEKRELKRFIQLRNIRGTDRSVVLLDLLSQERNRNLEGREVARLIYGKENLNAYHALRKRLAEKIQEYHVMRSFESGGHHQSEVTAAVRTARLCIARGKPKAARMLLEKVRKKAELYEWYEGLKLIVQTEVDNVDELGLDPERLDEEWRRVQRLANLRERVEFAHSLVQLKLREIRLGGDVKTLERFVRKQVEGLGVDLHEELPGSVILQIMKMIRMAIQARKTYFQLDPLLSETVKQLEERGKLQTMPTEQQIEFLYLLAHTKLRVRNFSTAIIHCDRIEQMLKTASRSTAERFAGRVGLIKASALNYSGRATDAIVLMHELLDSAVLRQTDVFNLRLNLAVMYFQQADFKSARTILTEHLYNERRIQQTMGTEWRFRKMLIETLTFYELDYHDLADSRLQSTKRYLRQRLTDEVYEAYVAMLKCIRWIFETGNENERRALASKVYDTLHRLPPQMEDLQLLAFYCWIDSKLTGVDYYLHMVQQTAQTGTNRIKHWPPMV